MRYVEQETLPRIDAGMDWGARRRMLIRTEDSRVQLFIRAGCQQAHGLRGLGSYYVPATLILTDGKRAPWLHQGRVTKAVLEKYMPDISRAFGTSSWFDVVDLRRTLVLP